MNKIFKYGSKNDLVQDRKWFRLCRVSILDHKSDHGKAAGLIWSDFKRGMGQPSFIDLDRTKEMEQMMPEVVVEQRTNTLLENKFNPNYTFENFIEGSSNKEAYAACFASCNQGSHPMFNPLMLLEILD